MGRYVSSQAVNDEVDQTKHLWWHATVQDEEQFLSCKAT
jgi:hypothetical protein